MFHKSAALAFAALCLQAAPGQAAQEWVMDEATSKLSFTAQQGDETFAGGFKKFSADIRFSPDDLANSKIAVTVDTASIFAGSDERDAALPGAAWFDSAGFPQATFTTERITAAAGADNYVADAQLTIRGVTQKMQLPFTLARQPDGKTRATGSVILQRNVFGIGQGEFVSDGWVKYPVTVRIDILASPKDGAAAPQ